MEILMPILYVPLALIIVSGAWFGVAAFDKLITSRIAKIGFLRVIINTLVVIAYFFIVGRITTFLGFR